MGPRVGLVAKASSLFSYLGGIIPNILSAPAWRHARVAVGLALAGVVAAYAVTALADPFPSPPRWDTRSGVHYDPVEWPADSDWIAYSHRGDEINDPRTLDPSHGGARPQNYVNVSSGCPDQSLPSVYYAYDAMSNTLFYRWRVEQIANNYATGPSAGPYSSGNPWGAALWTVFFDVDGDAYKELAAHLDGSSGSPSTPIDLLRGVYGDIPNHSIDYTTDPNVDEVRHNPTGFVNDLTTEIIVNFQGANTPTIDWPSGSATTFWDYGSSRLVDISTDTCIEYFVDYQIPLNMVDARPFGGPQISNTTPFSMFYATANSLNDPFQKDMIYEGDLVGYPLSSCMPYGDMLTLKDGIFQQPIVDYVIAAAGECGPAEFETSIWDAYEAPCDTTIQTVEFYYYLDKNLDGAANDGSTWTSLGVATLTSTEGADVWQSDLDTATIPRGQYLIGVEATDLDGHTTQSYLSTPDAGKYVNPSPDPGVTYAIFTNYCGTPPIEIVKAVTPSATTPSAQVEFTLQLRNETASSAGIANITDALPVGFTFVSTNTTTTQVSTTFASQPSLGASGTLLWSYSPNYSLNAGAIQNLVFFANTTSIDGTYYNTAYSNTTEGDIESEPVEIVIGAPMLTLAKVADVLTAMPGDTVAFTITYSNPSPGGTTDTFLWDEVPVGLSYVANSATSPGFYNSTTSRLEWHVGAVASGDGPFDVMWEATVDSPYTGDAKNTNTAWINSSETDDVSASASIYVSSASISLIKNGTTNTVKAGDSVTFDIQYKNTSENGVTGASLVDYMPDGFSYVSSSDSGSYSAGPPETVTWNIGNVAAGASGTRYVTLQALSGDYTNPAVNNAVLSTNETPDISDDFEIGFALKPCYAPVSGSDTSDSTFSVSNVQVQESTIGVGYTCASPTCDPYAVWIGAAIDTTKYQEFVFSTSMMPTGTGIRGATMRYVYGEKNTSGGRVDVMNQGGTTLFNIPIITGGGGKSVLSTVSLFANGVDSLGEINDLKYRVYDYKTSASGQYSFGTDVAQVCVDSVLLTIDKQVDKLSAAPGDTLAYTIIYSNSGTTDSAGAYVEDTLPAGVTYSSATMNGSPATPASSSGQWYKFIVNSTGYGAGIIHNGTSGKLVITATVDSPIATGIDTLTNYALLNSTHTTPVSDEVVTKVIVPALDIAKLVNTTLLYEGDSATYTLRVLNTGQANATGVTVTDVLPEYSYYVNSPGTISHGGAFTAATNTIDWSGLSVNKGSYIDLTFDMDAIPTIPSGTHAAINNATITGSTQVSGSIQSNDATVYLAAKPNLAITKTIAETGPLSPGDTITYDITVENIGSETAISVRFTDSIPDDTSYTAGSIEYATVAQTDADDSDEGRYDVFSSPARVVADIGDLAPGASHTIRFKVTASSALPAGTTTVSNTARVTATNASSKQATATIDVEATPVLTLGKVAPSELGFPLTSLNGAATATTSVVVDSVAYIAQGDKVYIQGFGVANVTAIDSASNTITVSPAVTAADNASVEPVFVYDLMYENTGEAQATSVVITDQIPSGILYINGTISDGGVWSAATNTVSWTLGNVPVGGSGTVSFQVRAIAADTYTNYAVINSADTANVSDTATTSLGSLLPEKWTTTPARVNSKLGTDAYYIINVTNQKGTIANGITIEDSFASGFTYNSTVSATSLTSNPDTIRYATNNPTLGDSTATWGVWNVGAGDTLQLRFTVLVANTVGEGTYQNALITNSSNTTSLLFDELFTTQEDVAVTLTNVDIGVTKGLASGYTNTPHRDAALRWTITAENTNATSQAEVVVMKDLLPTGTTYNATSFISNGTYSGSTGYWTIGDMSAGQRDTLVLEAIINTGEGSTVTNCAQLWSLYQTDEDSDNNLACHDIYPTLAFISDFKGYGEGGWSRLAWTTRSQHRTRGFNIFRQDAKSGEFVQVNKAMLPAKAGAVGGAAYEFVDETAIVGVEYKYIIEEVEVRGEKQTLGPFTVNFALSAEEAARAEYAPEKINPAHLDSDVKLKRKEGRVKRVAMPTGGGATAPAPGGTAAGFSPSPAMARDGSPAASLGAADGAASDEVVFLYFDGDGTIVVGTEPPGIKEGWGYEKTLAHDGTLMVSAGSGRREGTRPSRSGGAGAGQGAPARQVVEPQPVMVVTAEESRDIPVGTVEDIRAEASAAGHGAANSTGASSSGYFPYFGGSAVAADDASDAEGGETDVSASAGPTVIEYAGKDADETSGGTNAPRGGWSMRTGSATQASGSVAGGGSYVSVSYYDTQERARLTLSQSGLDGTDLSDVYDSEDTGQKKPSEGGSDGFRDERVGNVIKIYVERDGLYYMSMQDVARMMGLNEGKTASLLRRGQLALMSQGRNVPYMADADYDGFYFYGMRPESEYTGTNVYWLYNADAAHMYVVGGAAPEGVATGAEVFHSVSRASENALALYTMLNDPVIEDNWIWAEQIGGISGYDMGEFTVAARGVADTSGEASIRVTGHGTYADMTGDHENPASFVRVSVNGSIVGDVWYRGETGIDQTLRFSQGLLVEGDNTVTLQTVNATNNVYAVFWLDALELGYDRLYAAHGDRLEFTGAAGGVVSVSGFGSSEIMVYDISDPLWPRYVSATKVSAWPDGTYAVTMSPSTGDSTYLAIAAPAVETGYDAWADAESALVALENRADYLIIAPEEFALEARELSNYRQGQGLEPMVVYIEDVYDEFGDGLSSPLAIADFLRYAVENWQLAPRYVVLAGEGTYDYMDYMGYGGNWIPAYMADTLYGRVASDNYLADTDSDGTPNLAIGRIPVDTAEELAAYLAKVKAYEAQGQWNAIALMLSDNPDDGGDYEADSALIGEAIEMGGYGAEYVSLGGVSGSSARATVLGRLGAGDVSLLNFAGHGSGYDLTFEGVLTASDAASLGNAEHAPMVFAATCFVGDYSVPGEDMFAESWVMAEGGGAIAMLSPTGLSLHLQAMVLDEAFVEARYQGGVDLLGDALMRAYEGYAEVGGSVRYITDVYNLIGDPALRLR